MIDNYLAEIREDLAVMVSSMRAKGYERARAEFSIAPDGVMQIHLDTAAQGENGPRAFVMNGWVSAYVFPKGKIYCAVLAEAQAHVENMKVADHIAAMAWFEPVADAPLVPAEI